jgi:LacI family transcriptional regulator
MPSMPEDPDAPRQPVTMQDVANRMGVSVSTVSLALAGKHTVSEATRRRAREVAEEMGYRKSPLVAALMESRRSGRSVQGSPVLAHLTMYDTRDGWSQWPAPNFYPGCVAEATRLGYKLETFWTRDPEFRPERLNSVLIARGIQGVLIGPCGPDPKLSESLIKLDWDRFSVVALSRKADELPVDRVSSDHYGNMREAVTRCIAGGFKRIGFMARGAADAVLQHRWHGAYLAHLKEAGLDAGLEPHLDYHLEEKFLAWFRRVQPEAIIGVVGQNTVDWLSRAGVAVPRDVSLISVVVGHPGESLTGMVEDRSFIGARAVRHLVNLIQHSETGFPKIPQLVTLPGQWNEGQTWLPRRPVPASLSPAHPDPAMVAEG